MRRAGYFVAGAVAQAIAESAGVSAVKVNAGSFTVNAGDSADIVLPQTFTPKVIIFWTAAAWNLRASFAYGSNPAFPLHDTTATNVLSHGVTHGAYDGSTQFSEAQGSDAVEGRRDGGSWNDAAIDHSTTLNPTLGCRLRGTTFNSTEVRLVFDRSIATGEGPMTVQWMVIGGCNAKIVKMTIPPGTYGDVGPSGVALAGLPFRARGIISSPWRQNWVALNAFATAWAGPAQGYASDEAGTIRQGSVGSSTGYDGHVFSFAHTGAFCASSRNDGVPADTPTLLGTVQSFTADGWIVNCESADGGSASYYDLPVIALDCPCRAGLTSLNSSAGPLSISGSAFRPVAALLAAVPSVEATQTISYPLPAASYALRGNMNVSLGFVAQTATGLKQGGLAMFDTAGYAGVPGTYPDVVVNGREKTALLPSQNGACHDASALCFSDAVIKGQNRSTYTTFSTDVVLAATGFVADGLNFTQSAANGRAGKLAYLLIGGGIPDLGQNAAFNGYRALPEDSEWYADVSARALDPNSAKYINAANPSFAAVDGSIDPNWSFIVEASPSYGGIPYYVMDTSLGQPQIPVIRTAYLEDSDYGPFPIPFAAKIEGDPADVGSYGYSDRHLLALDRATGVIYQFFGTNGGEYLPSSDGVKWRAKSTGVFDNVSNEPRRYGYDSGDAAGACLLAGIIRYDEIVAGEITHAARFTTHNLGIYYCLPAMKTALSGIGYNRWKFIATAGQTVFSLTTDFTNSITNAAQLRVAVNGTILSSGYSISGGGVTLTLSSGLAAGDFLSVTYWQPPAGIHLRLKASFAIGAYSAVNQIILRGLKKYGMINCDTGSTLAVTADADPRWDQTDLNALTALRASDFEVVTPPNIYHLERNPGQSDGPPSGSAPTITSFTASAAIVSHGSPVTLSWAVSGATGVVLTPEYGVVVAGVTSAIVTPQYDTVYKLVATNRWGRVSKHVYVETT